MNDKTTFIREYLYNQLLGIYEAWVLKGFEIELDPDVNKISSKNNKYVRELSHVTLASYLLKLSQ